MNRKELVEKIWKNNHGGIGLSKTTIDNIVGDILNTVKTTVKKGETVSLIGFGSITKQKRKGRLGVNPQTGERMQIKATWVPKFRPGKGFKDLLNKR